MADRREDAAQDALFREVDEELRHEQMASLWKKYGGVVIAAALAVVLSVAGYQGWKYWQNSVREDEAARYQAALTLLEQGDTQEAWPSGNARQRGVHRLRRHRGPARRRAEGRAGRHRRRRRCLSRHCGQFRQRSGVPRPCNRSCRPARHGGGCRESRCIDRRASAAYG